LHAYSATLSVALFLDIHIALAKLNPLVGEEKCKRAFFQGAQPLKTERDSGLGTFAA
jgi:hypothetical protein